MALSSTEEAQTRALIAQQAAILSLASSEPIIISKLAATKVSLADLTAATSLSDTDLFLVRQGTTEKSVTKSLISNVIADASETVKGIVELATSSETLTGTDNTRAIHPAGLMSGFVKSLITNGYQKLPSGLIIQWGITSAITSGTEVNITLPITFPNGFINSVASRYSTGVPSTAVSVATNSLSLSQIKASYFNTGGGNSQISFVVIGY